MKLAKSLIVIALSTSLISGCSIDESLSSLGSASISEITDEIINQTLDIAGAISNDSTEQDYINSEMKGAVDDLMGIIEKSYETAIKQEMTYYFDSASDYFNDEQIKVINKLEHPLDELYDDWLDNDFGIGEDIRLSIDEFTYTLIDKEKESKVNGYER